MKSLLYVLLFLFCSCSVNKNAVSYESAQKETLINVYSKIVSKGEIYFLRYEEGRYRMLAYGYDIDKHSKKVDCRLLVDAFLDDIDNRPAYVPAEWHTSFNGGKGIQAYFDCFADGFLDMSNEEKLVVMRRLSDKNKD